MEDQDHKVIVRFYKKWIEPFMAIFIIALLGTIVFLLVQESSKTKEINEKCGWGDEKFKCYCQKDDVEKIDLLLNLSTYGLQSLNASDFNLENVSLVE